MATSAAQDRLLDRLLQLAPQEFEVLCKLVLAGNLRTTRLAVTPASQDGGIDIEGRLDYDWFAADFGVQVKRYSRGNVVGNDRIHRLAGALTENGYDVGTFVTTSSYTGPARETAKELPIQLISGDDLTEAMLQTQIGVTAADEPELDATFWQELAESDEQVPASEVPLANNLDRIRDVLGAIQHTVGSRDAIQCWVGDHTGYDLSNRHVRINANSATVLGLARKEPSASNQQAARWGLTRTGADYLRAQPGSVLARRILQQAIRSVELVERVHAAVADAGELAKSGIDELIVDETSGLSESSVERRSSAIRTWLAFLPEIGVEWRQGSKTYVYVGDGGEDGAEPSSPDGFGG